jgi:CRP-like cAMP-binding protein
MPARIRRGQGDEQTPLPPDSLPSLRTVAFSRTAAKGATRLLSRRQQHQLAAMSSRLRLKTGTVIYAAEAEADSVFIIGAGVVKAVRHLANGSRCVMAFLFPEDIFGLAEEGRYVNSTQAVTDVSLYRIPVHILRAALQHDAALDFQFLCKVTNQLREAQRQTIVVGRRHAGCRVAMLLRMLERHEPEKTADGHIAVPMSAPTRQITSGFRSRPSVALVANSNEPAS